MTIIEPKCVECGEEFALEELKHIWMEYDPAYLEEGDETSTYVGLMCKDCLKAASEMCGMPVTVVGQLDEEEIA
jgi:hypothetical protein